MTYKAVQPARYISSYDPSEGERMQNLMIASQAKYDQSFGNLLNEEARQGDIFFINPEDKKIAQSNFQSQVDDILQRYEGDYGAAAKELSKTIVKERNNPAYQLSQYQLQKAQEANKLKAQLGPDAIVVKDVPESLYDNGRLRNINELDYNIMKRSNYDDIIVDATKGIAGSIEQSNLTQSEKDYYLKQITEKGLARLNNEDKRVLAGLVGNKLENESTWKYDPAVQGASPYDYALKSFDRLISSGIQQDYMFDRARLENERLDRESSKISPNLLYSAQDRGVDIPNQSNTINNYVDSVNQLNRVEQNKGKLDVLTNVQGITQQLGQQLSPGGIASSLLSIRDDVTQFNAWIEAAKLEDTKSVEHFTKKDSEGNYMFTGGNDMAGATKIGKILYDMQSNDQNYLDKVSKKKEEYETQFKDEYGQMYDYLRDNGIPENQIIPMIQQSQQYYQFNKTFDLNADVVAPKIHQRVISGLGQNVKIYDVSDDGEISDKPIKEGRDALLKSNAGTIQNATIDPQTGSVLLTYENKNGFNTYAIKAGTRTLDNTGDKILTSLKDFTNNLNNAKVPEKIIQVDNNTGYYIKRDPRTLRPIIKQIKIDNGSITAMSTEIDAEFVYDDLLTQFLRSQGIENEPKPTKF